MNLYLDIETIPGQRPGLRDEIANTITPPANYKKADTIAKWEAEQKPALIEEQWRKTALSGDRGEIVCIGWAFDDEPIITEYRHVEHCMEKSQGPFTTPPSFYYNERVLLICFFDAIKKRLREIHMRPPMWVGHNVRDFDLRFIFHRAVILGMKPPFYLPHNARSDGAFLYDTMEAWAGFRNRISLDRLCDALGIPRKGSELGGEPIDGSKVWNYVKAGRIKEVAAYCAGDVMRVREVHKRLTFADLLQDTAA